NAERVRHCLHPPRGRARRTVPRVPPRPAVYLRVSRLPPHGPLQTRRWPDGPGRGRQNPRCPGCVGTTGRAHPGLARTSLGAGAPTLPLISEDNSMRKKNKGWFRKGYDPRRHVLSRAERQKGYWVATRFSKMPSRVRAWLRSNIKRHYLTSRKAG